MSPAPLPEMPRAPSCPPDCAQARARTELEAGPSGLTCHHHLLLSSLPPTVLRVHIHSHLPCPVPPKTHTQPLSPSTFVHTRKTGPAHRKAWGGAEWGQCSHWVSARARAWGLGHSLCSPPRVPVRIQTAVEPVSADLRAESRPLG